MKRICEKTPPNKIVILGSLSPPLLGEKFGVSFTLPCLLISFQSVCHQLCGVGRNVCLFEASEFFDFSGCSDSGNSNGQVLN